MNKSQLIDKISDDSNISKTEAERAVDAFMTTVSDALTAGDTVSLRGFGTFAVQADKVRTGRNPLTGEVIEIPGSRVPRFKPSKALIDALK